MNDSKIFQLVFDVPFEFIIIKIYFRKNTRVILLDHTIKLLKLSQCLKLEINLIERTIAAIQLLQKSR